MSHWPGPHLFILYSNTCLETFQIASEVKISWIIHWWKKVSIFILEGLWEPVFQTSSPCNTKLPWSQVAFVWIAAQAISQGNITGPRLSTPFHIHELTDSQDWVSLLWLTWEQGQFSYSHYFNHESPDDKVNIFPLRNFGVPFIVCIDGKWRLSSKIRRLGVQILSLPLLSKTLEQGVLEQGP